MTQDKVVVEKCCFCIPKRQGLLAYGYIIMIYHLLNFAFIIAALCLSEGKVLRTLDFFDTTMMIANVIHLVFSFLLIYGGHKKTPKWLKIFFWYQLTAIFLNLFMDSLYLYTTDAFVYDPIFSTLTLLTLYGILCPCVIYLLIIVRSSYLKMERNYPVAYTTQADF